MSYRDDHDAAISRIDALEAELAKTREGAHDKAERDARKIAMLERELADLRRHGEAPKRKSAPIIKTTAAIDELDRQPVVSAPAIHRVLLVALVGCIVGLACFAFFVARDDAERRPVITDCTVQSEPPAELVGTANGIEIKLGITPVRLPFDEWRDFDRLQLKHDDYDDLGITVPRDEIACNGSHTYKLFRK